MSGLHTLENFVGEKIGKLWAIYENFTCQYSQIIKPETLTSGNYDEFGESESNCQTLSFQSKATKQISVQY